LPHRGRGYGDEVETTVTLGDVEVARIGLGTNRLRDTPENTAFVRLAVAAGVGYIDTAHTYTDGASERTIGAASTGPEVVVGTKGGFAPGTGSPERLRAQVEESLRRLRVESIALYYLHRVDPETSLEESLGALAECREGGKIRHVGLSQVDVEQIERARKVVPVTVVQNHYNLAERRFDEVVDHCAREGIVFVPYFPLRDDGGRPVAEIAERHGTTPAQITLAWLLRRSPAMLPIPGSLSIDHVRENLAALELELSDGDFEALR
jgi:aryl-alcohol dehydrogenase-like predicted oxidoreductase